MGVYEMKKPKKINSFSVTLTLITVTVLYGLYFFIPAWWPIFQETGIMSGICNDAYREFSNEKLMEKLLKESRRTGLHLSKENFVLERLTYTRQELEKFNGNEFFANRGKECRLSLTYTTPVEWPLLGKKTEMTFRRSVKTDLSLVKY